MFYQILDISGTIAFAISGVLVAMEKRLDVFGLIIIAFVTAIGGGTLRDLLIGNTPVVWMRDGTYVLTILGSVLCSILFAKQLKYLRKSLLLFDTIGIGVFTIIGIQKGLEADLSPVICMALGTMTACFGGVIRDTLCNDIPVIFRKEIYATACICGGLCYFLLDTLSLPSTYINLISVLVVIIIRLLAVRFNVALPNIYRNTSG